MNGGGVAVGGVTPDPQDGTVAPALWVPGDPPAFLPASGSDTRSFATAINDSGVIVGYGGNSDGSSVHPLMWVGGARTVLDPLGHTVARAVDVNSSGVAVGHMGDGDLDTEPFNPAVWIPGDPGLELPTLGGSSAVATGVNDAGVVIGMSYTAGDADAHMFRWTAAEGMEDLGTPNPSAPPPINELYELIGPKINNAGQVALLGFGMNGPIGYAWTQDDGFVELPPFPGQPQFAFVLNIDDAGRIVGASATGQTGHAALWQIQQPDPPDPLVPPEPSTPPGPPEPPGPGTDGGDAGNSPSGGSDSGSSATGSVPTLPATGRGAVPVFLALAAALLVAGGALATGVSRSRRPRETVPRNGPVRL